MVSGHELGTLGAAGQRPTPDRVRGMFTGMVVGAVLTDVAYIGGLYWFCWRKQGNEFRGETW